MVKIGKLVSGIFKDPHPDDFGFVDKVVPKVFLLLVFD